MLYEMLKIIVAVLGPVVIYTTIISMMRVPDQIMALPRMARYALEAVGGLFIIGAWLMVYVDGGSLSGAMALIGLLLLATPSVANKMNHASPGGTEIW